MTASTFPAMSSVHAVEFLRRALRWRTRECLELDLRGEREAAADRAQRIGEALLFPAVGVASLLVEEIQCGGIVPRTVG